MRNNRADQRNSGLLLLKVKPHADYPVEKAHYLRGNDFSPMAGAIILNLDDNKILPEI